MRMVEELRIDGAVMTLEWAEVPLAHHRLTLQGRRKTSRDMRGSGRRRDDDRSSYRRYRSRSPRFRDDDRSYRRRDSRSPPRRERSRDRDYRRCNCVFWLIFGSG